ncbi:MAG: YCF48-related protein [Rubrivivax sp.]
MTGIQQPPAVGGAARLRVAALLTSLALAGCGGGGGGSTPPPDPRVAGLRCSGPDHTGWCWQSPQPWAPVLDDVVFDASGTGWAAGDALLHSADGGQSWQELPLPGGEPARSVRFVDADEGWLLSSSGGALWHTRDGARRWTRAATLPFDTATALVSVGSRSLLVNGLTEDRVHPVTLLSEDAGLTWRESFVPVSPEDVEFDGTLWANGLQSTDFGRVFNVPGAWGVGPAYRTRITGRGSVFAWRHLCDPDTSRCTAQAQQRRSAGGDWTPVATPPLPAGHGLVDIAVFADGGWALSNGPRTSNAYADPVPWTLWRRGADDTWAALSTPTIDWNGFGVLQGFVDGRTAWLRSSDRLLISTDGGRDWLGATSPPDSAGALRFMRRDGAGALLAGYGGDGLLTGAERWYRSTDDGRSWRALPGSQAPDAITGLWPLDPDHLLASTSGGGWLDTANGGHDWAARPPAARLPGPLRDLQFTADGTGWVVTRVQRPPLTIAEASPPATGRVYRSRDQGRSWLAVTLPAEVDERVRELQFVDDRNGFLRAATSCDTILPYCFEQVWATGDGGASWQPRGGEQLAGGLQWMRSATQGVMVWPGGRHSTATLVSWTEDGGRTWSDAIELPGSTATEWARRMVGAGDRVWILTEDYTGGSAVLYLSTDGGRRWTRQAVELPPDARYPLRPYEPTLNDMAFVDDRHGWIVGRQGLVLATTDGGATWQRQASGTRQDLLTLRVQSDRRVWIGGSAGSILSTVSGGR